MYLEQSSLAGHSELKVNRIGNNLEAMNLHSSSHIVRNSEQLCNSNIKKERLSGAFLVQSILNSCGVELVVEEKVD